jgi:hypothetical protein
MKLRLFGNSLRYRLSRTDVAELDNNGAVRASINFGPKSLVYEISSDPELAAAVAELHDQTISVRVPKSSVSAWVNSEDVTISAKQKLDDGRLLSISIEKDFSCLKPRSGDEDADTFPHPMAVEKAN